MKKIITAIIAAGMVMSTATAISASAESTEIKSDEFNCIWDLPQPPTLFEQVKDLIDRIMPKKAEPEKKAETTKPRLKDMSYLELLRYVKENYNMDGDQLYTAWADIRTIILNGVDIEYAIEYIRYKMEYVSRFGCIPSWNEDMIRFARDFWDQMSELYFKRCGPGYETPDPEPDPDFEDEMYY